MGHLHGRPNLRRNGDHEHRGDPVREEGSSAGRTSTREAWGGGKVNARVGDEGGDDEYHDGEDGKDGPDVEAEHQLLDDRVPVIELGVSVLL